MGSPWEQSVLLHREGAVTVFTVTMWPSPWEGTQSSALRSRRVGDEDSGVAVPVQLLTGRVNSRKSYLSTLRRSY